VLRCYHVPVSGRFLRVSQTLPRGGPRSQVAIPAQGMGEFHEALSSLLEQHGTDDMGKPQPPYRYAQNSKTRYCTLSPLSAKTIYDKSIGS